MTSGRRFPDDENGDVLRRMAARGVDLVSPRVIDFDHRFPNESAAKRFLEAVERTVHEAMLIAPEDEGSDWEVKCRQRMVPSHAAITETEERLGAVARRFEGDADGWGTMSNPDGSPAD
jgi:hypothetical protein